MTDDKNNPDPINVFSFFIAVATIIATVVSEMLKNSGIQDEYVFVAVFSMFMAMSFALGHVYSSNKNNGMNKIAGAFLDAFLALSVSIVITRYLSDNSEDFIISLPRVIALFSVAFFLFIFSIYMSEESLKLKLSLTSDVPENMWEYLGMAVSIAVFCIVGLIKSGLSSSHDWIFLIIALVTFLLVLCYRIKSVILGVLITLCSFLLIVQSKVILISGFLLMFFIKLFLDDVLFVSSVDEDSKEEKLGNTKRGRRDKR
ncbi:hypothetical protein [Thermococcus sp.]|uniref:hypothetical protein n=1 Tax=Thermococcus sp. TaxID=35749 RepID=UPI0026207C20|nr:hypothetical protein [Thermococcus sp.]